jgi:hypothetical protein
MQLLQLSGQLLQLSGQLLQLSGQKLNRVRCEWPQRFPDVPSHGQAA